MRTADAEGKRFSPPPEKCPAIWLVLDLVPNKRGSLERQLLALAGRLTSGARLTYVFAAPPPDWLGAALAVHGVDVRVLEFAPPAQAALTFWRWARAARPTLVHFHFVRAYSPLVAVARALGARVMLHDHMALGRPVVPVAPRGAAHAALVRGYKWARAAALNDLCDLRVAVSRFVADSVRRAEHMDPARISVVEHGIELGRFLDAEGGSLRAELGAGRRPIVACVSRMAPEKGVDRLIRAFGLVARDALLVIAGDGPDGPRCQALAAALGLADRVRFLGLRDDVERVYAAADVVVAPSLCDEAFGLAVVEAMATGRPVVVSAAGAMPELCDFGRSGLVVPPGDVAALAGAIERLLRDRALAARLATAARERARTAYGLATWLERMAAIYSRLLDGELAPAARRAA